MSSNLDIHKESTDQITARMVNKFEELSGDSLELSDERRWMLQAIAYGLFVRNQATNEGLKMNFVQHTKGYYADEIGEFTDTHRLEAKSASVILRFSIEEAKDDILAVNPTRVTPGNDIYFITDYFEFKAGETIKDILATCTETGEVGNGFLAGEVNKIVDPFPFFDSVVNLEITQGGAEIETDPSLTERIREAPSKFSTAGPIDAYVYWAKTANQEIIDVNVGEVLPGEVRITPLITGGELPTDSILAQVYEVCNDEKRRPLTDKVTVNKPSQIEYDIELTYYISSSKIGVVNEVQEEVDLAVSNYVLWQKELLKRDINPTELNYLIRAAGAKRVEILKPNFTVVDRFEVAKERNINVTFGGLEDD